jgi:hypothetical protein
VFGRGKSSLTHNITFSRRIIPRAIITIPMITLIVRREPVLNWSSFSTGIPQANIARMMIRGRTKKQVVN